MGLSELFDCCGGRGIYPRQAQVLIFFANSLDRALDIPIHICKKTGLQPTFLQMRGAWDEIGTLLNREKVFY